MALVIEPTTHKTTDRVLNLSLIYRLCVLAQQQHHQQPTHRMFRCVAVWL